MSLARIRIYADFTRPFTLLPPTLGVISGAITAFGSASNPDPARRLTLSVITTVLLGSACAALDASLGEPPAPGPAITVTGPAILLAPAPGGSGAPVIFTAELTWAEHALVQRLHLLDHRGQIRTLRTALAAGA